MYLMCNVFAFKVLGLYTRLFVRGDVISCLSVGGTACPIEMMAYQEISADKIIFATEVSIKLYMITQKNNIY